MVPFQGPLRSIYSKYIPKGPVWSGWLEALDFFIMCDSLVFYLLVGCSPVCLVLAWPMMIGRTEVKSNPYGFGLGLKWWLGLGCVSSVFPPIYCWFLGLCCGFLVLSTLFLGNLSGPVIFHMLGEVYKYLFFFFILILFVAMSSLSIFEEIPLELFSNSTHGLRLFFYWKLRLALRLQPSS